MIYLDTHVVAWLHGIGAARIPAAARDAIEGADDIRISPMVRLELKYLFEMGRLSEPPLIVLDAIQAPLGLTICDASFIEVARLAESQNWTRDPFDRLIVAHAALHEAELITKDEYLHAHYPRCVW